MKTEDPTRYEILREIADLKRKTLNLYDWNDESRWFTVETAIYWFANDWHAGQWSNLYSVLSTSDYSPSYFESGIDDCEDFLAKEIYETLEIAFCCDNQGRLALKPNEV